LIVRPFLGKRTTFAGLLNPDRRVTLNVLLSEPRMNAEAVQALVEKLKSLPPDQRAEVEDFVDFLRARKERARDAAAQRLGDAFKKLDALDQTPPSAEEVQSEIDAARAERRARHADRR